MRYAAHFDAAIDDDYFLLPLFCVYFYFLRRCHNNSTLRLLIYVIFDDAAYASLSWPAF